MPPYYQIYQVPKRWPKWLYWFRPKRVLRHYNISEDTAAYIQARYGQIEFLSNDVALDLRKRFNSHYHDLPTLLQLSKFSYAILKV